MELYQVNRVCTFKVWASDVFSCLALTQLQNTFSWEKVWIDAQNQLSLYFFPQSHFSRSAGGSVSALVRRQCRGKPFAACAWLVLLDSRSSNTPMAVPHLPKCPLHSGLSVLTWMYREMDSRKEEFTWYLTLSKVTYSSGALQESNTPGDLLI